MSLIDYIACSLAEQDHGLGNDIEPYDYYTAKAECAIEAFESFRELPRPTRHFPEVR